MGKYPGDALWALMVFLGWGIIFPGISTRRIAVYALATSSADEFSQLYHAPWIDSIRSTFLGHIILGEGFVWFDLVAYTIGIFIGMLGESALHSGALGAASQRLEHFSPCYRSTSRAHKKPDSLSFLSCRPNRISFKIRSWTVLQPDDGF